MSFSTDCIVITMAESLRREILSLKQELKELEQLGVKIQKVLDEAKQMNSEGHDAQ